MNIKKVIKHILKPPLYVIVLCDIFALPVTVFALSALAPKNPVSLFAYLLSAYALTVTVISFKKLVRRIKELATGDELAAVRALKGFMRRYKYTGLYLESRDFRAETALYTGLAINLLYACYNGVLGIHNRSLWFVTLGVYFLLVGVIRFVLMIRVRESKSAASSYTDRKLYEYAAYRLCGCMVMALNIVIAGIAVVVIKNGGYNYHSRLMTIISAAFTFYCFISSAANVVSFRRRDNAILSAAKDLNMIGALVSMYSLQATMLHAFGSNDEENFRDIMNIITGAVVFAAVFIIASYMVINGTHRLNAVRERAENGNEQ